MVELDPELYTIAWLAPLEIEAKVALHMLDKQHRGRFPMSRGDDYVFQAGDVCGHNVIIATLPAGQEYGTGSAAALASQVKRFFPNLWFGLLVGVAAGLPNLSRKPPLDIRLGDVLVGMPDGENAGLIAYDLGKETGQDGFQLLHFGRVLATTETVVRSAIGSIKLKAPNDAETFLPYYECIKYKEHPGGTFIDPGQENDELYQVDDDGAERLVERERRLDSKRTRVWYGPIGSGEKLMKNARKRNELRDRHNIIGLEMEAAGTMNRIPVGVIRGVCDYGDEHKNKEWQPYAAAIAAAYAKAVLAEISPKSAARKGSTLQNMALGVDARIKRRFDEHSLRVTRLKRHCSEDSNNQSMETFLVGAKAVSRSLNEEQKQKLLDSLGFDHIDDRHNTIEKAHAKTCKWLLRKSEYLDWLDLRKLEEHHGFLWIKGNPGAGKSTLMKFALNNTQRQMKAKVISFFFNARGRDLEKSTMGMYRSLLLQLLEQLPRLQSVFDSLGLATRNGTPPQWTVELLKALFEQAVHSLGNDTLVCFIDALDECDELQVRDMVSFFERVGELTTSHGTIFQVCFSSRHYYHITISKGLDLDLGEQEGHNQDIVSYLDCELKIGHGQLAEQIRGDLIRKASGVFMWVKLVVRILQQEYDHGRTHTLRQRLEDIPGDLHELFHDILTRDHHHKDELLLCIQWVLFTRQPLEPEELYYAVLAGVDPNATSDRTTYVTKHDIKKFILSSSKGLVEVTRSINKPTVQFIHESVRDFLCNENGIKEIWLGHWRNFQGESHDRLKECCLGYMRIVKANLNINPSMLTELSNDAEYKRQSAKWKFPFVEYAVQNVLYHADAAEGGGASQTTFVQTFQLTDWIKFENLLEKHSVRRHTPNVSLLYLLAEHNAGNLIGCHPDKLSCFKEEDERYGMPFLAALATGSRDAVSAFLKAQSDTEPWKSHMCEQDYQNGDKRTGIGRDLTFSPNRNLLSYLAEAGDERILAFFLASAKYNADLESKSKAGRTPLAYATGGGQEAAVRLLLDKGANIEATDVVGRTPLSWASKEGYETVARLLLDRDAHIEAADNAGRTPLSWAAGGGHEAAVRLLLGKGANIEAADVAGQTPLLWAAEKGEVEVVQLLIDRGANIEAVNVAGQTPLLWAAEKGEAEVVQLLIDRGAYIEAVDKTGNTPLLCAVTSSASIQRTDTVLLLLNGGANVEVVDKDGRTPLIWAVAFSSSITKQLLDIGANIEAADKDGRTPLSWAITYSIANAKQLLQKGANIEADDKNGRTPLSWAATDCFTKNGVQLLLDHGAYVGAVDKDGQTPLSLAETSLYSDIKKRKAIIKLLRDRGATIKDASDSDKLPPS